MVSFYTERGMGSIKGLIRQIKRNPKDVRFADIQKVCQYYFGEPRLTGGHYIYKTPWKGDPRINIQNDKGKAKGYQVKQVLKAIERMEVEHGTAK
jgi:hypothetical protein